MKKLLALLLAVALIATLAACGGKAETPADQPAADQPAENQPAEADKPAETEKPDEAAPAGESYKIFLITMDQMDQYWTNIDAGCQKAAAAGLRIPGLSVVGHGGQKEQKSHVVVHSLRASQ